VQVQVPVVGAGQGDLHGRSPGGFGNFTKALEDHAAMAETPASPPPGRQDAWSLADS
jgi:hypothetical protein